MRLSDIAKTTTFRHPLPLFFLNSFSLFHNKRASWASWSFLSTIASKYCVTFSSWFELVFEIFAKHLVLLWQYSRKGRQQTNYLFNFLTGDTSYLENISLLTHSVHSTTICINIKVSNLGNPRKNDLNLTGGSSCLEYISSLTYSVHSTTIHIKSQLLSIPRKIISTWVKRPLLQFWAAYFENATRAKWAAWPNYCLRCNTPVGNPIIPNNEWSGNNKRAIYFKQ